MDEGPVPLLLVSISSLTSAMMFVFFPVSCSQFLIFNSMVLIPIIESQIILIRSHSLINQSKALN